VVRAAIHFGRAGADVFQFLQASTGRVSDFEDGVDRLRIQSGPGLAYEDLVITTFGPRTSIPAPPARKSSSNCRTSSAAVLYSKLG